MSTADCTSQSQMTASPMPSAFYEYTKVLCRSFLFSSLNEDERNRISRLSPPSEQFCPDKLENKELVGILMTLAGEIDSRFSQPSNMDQTIEQLGLSDEGVDRVRDVYMEIINVMFRKMNWGRIVAMLAFLRMLVVYLLKRDRLSDVHALIESTAVYCDERLRFWIQMHGGWVRFLLSLLPISAVFSLLFQSCCDMKWLQQFCAYSTLHGVFHREGFFISPFYLPGNCVEYMLIVICSNHHPRYPLILFLNGS
ncbi:hypothetical protein D915_005075 [Fasciola hepatica]|uniref:Bcl-2 Bcl-2 homology region 1-3 domain-containing protein n=1 Tax=Fasciola hepatica TaxID=6192 RepID=A0A4E0RBB9_FASHE|nr:hypothetical protein D915_005075 [Fasciola hepatica]